METTGFVGKSRKCAEAPPRKYKDFIDAGWANARKQGDSAVKRNFPFEPWPTLLVFDVCHIGLVWKPNVRILVVISPGLVRTNSPETLFTIVARRAPLNKQNPVSQPPLIRPGLLPKP